MKRKCAFLLAALMALSLAACGGQTPPAASADEDLQQSEQSQNDTVQNEAEIVPSFDTSWAGNTFEKQVPEFPFADWSEGEAHAANAYYMEAHNVLYTDVKAYCELLTEEAFTEHIWLEDDSDGAMYRMSGDSKAGFSITCDFGAYSYDEPMTGTVSITIFDNRIADSMKVGASWGDEELDRLFPALPEGTWEGDLYEDEWSKRTGKTCTGLTLEEVKNYAETLKAAGFTNDMSEDPEDGLYSFRGGKTNSKLHVSVRVEENGDGTLLTEAWAVQNKR